MNAPKPIAETHKCSRCGREIVGRNYWGSIRPDLFGVELGRYAPWWAGYGLGIVCSACMAELGRERPEASSR